MTVHRSPALYLPRKLDARYVVEGRNGKFGVTTRVEDDERRIPLMDARIADPGWYVVCLDEERGATFEDATEDEIKEAREHVVRSLPVYDRKV